MYRVEKLGALGKFLLSSSLQLPVFLRSRSPSRRGWGIKRARQERGKESRKERMEEGWKGELNETRLTNRPTNCIWEELIKTSDGGRYRWRSVKGRFSIIYFIFHKLTATPFFYTAPLISCLSFNFISYQLRNVILLSFLHLPYFNAKGGWGEARALEKKAKRYGFEGNDNYDWS